MIVSPYGADELKCLTDSSIYNCRSLVYAIAQGASLICLKGTHVMHDVIDTANINVDVVRENKRDMQIFCNGCVIINSSISMPCGNVGSCKYTFNDLSMKHTTLILSNVTIIFKNTSLEQVVFTNKVLLDTADHIRIEFLQSTVKCFGQERCGFHQMTKVSLISHQSRLTCFSINLNLSAIAVILMKTIVYQPNIALKVSSIQYQRVPSVIYFEEVQFTGLLQSNITDYSNLVFHLSNPFIMVKKCHFIHTSVQLYSEKQIFDSVIFLVQISQSEFYNSFGNGNGGTVTIISEVQHSKVNIVSSSFLNNSASESISSFH